MAKKKKAAKKAKTTKSRLVHAARTIGTALGTLTVQAEAIAAKAREVLPTAKEAQGFVNEMVAAKNRAIAQIKDSSKARKK